MSSSLPKPLLRLKYEKAAQAYLRSLPLEHFMEATAQAHQRKITLASLDLVHARRPEVQVFNELLVQYPLPEDRIGQIVPDNMVVIHEEPIKAEGSYDLPLQLARPFWVLEYVSKHSQRKDYEGSFTKYEQELKVPYYLTFFPEAQEMNLFKRRKAQYASVRLNKHGRCPVLELDLEIGLLDGWARYWYQGQLLPLPADLQRQLDETGKQLDQERQRADQERQRADQERQRADQERQSRLTAERELAELRAQLEQLRQQRS